MLYALDQNGLKIPAQKNGVGYCPHCKSIVLPKCGLVKLWHWAHKSLETCDPWREAETEWHREWKSKFRYDLTEVIIEKKGYGNRHIADYYNSETKTTIEFQRSPISHQESVMRELFYDNLIWVVRVDFNTVLLFHDDCYKKPYDAGFIEECDGYDGYNKIFWTHRFRWKHPKKWVQLLPKHHKMVVLDLVNTEFVFIVSFITRDTPCHVRGFLIRRDVFTKSLINQENGGV